MPAALGEIVKFTAAPVVGDPGATDLYYQWFVEDPNVLGQIDPGTNFSDTMYAVALAPGITNVWAKCTNHPCAPDPDFCDECPWIRVTIQVFEQLPPSCNVDCNDNGIIDWMDIDSGFSADCNDNGIPDECDIANGDALDDDLNGIPDSCECGCTDLVFVLDTTESMNVAIAGIKEAANELISIAQSRSSGDLRAGLITFSDEIVVHNALTTDLDAVRDNILALVETPGNGAHEASDEALREAITMDALCVVGPNQFDVPYREECYKKIILVTDLLPAGCDDSYNGDPGDPNSDYNNALQRALDAQSARIEISSVFIVTPFAVGLEEEIRFLMQSYTEQTGGVFVELPPGDEGAGIVPAIESALNACVDCNGNGVLDAEDIELGISFDSNLNGRPDECERCPGDVDGDGEVGYSDLLAVQSNWGPCPGCPEDQNHDLEVGFEDLLLVLNNWGLCPEICDDGYLAQPGDPSYRYCEDTFPWYRAALRRANLAMGVELPVTHPNNIFCRALEALGQEHRYAQVTTELYWEVSHTLDMTVKVWFEDGEGPIHLRLVPEYEPSGDPWSLAVMLAEEPANADDLDVIVWTDSVGGEDSWGPVYGPCEQNEMQHWGQPSELDFEGQFLLNQARSIFVTTVGAVKTIDVAINITMSVCHVTSPCFIVGMLNSYEEIVLNGNSCAVFGVNCMANLTGQGFQFTQVTGLVRVLFYYGGIWACDTLHNGLGTGDPGFEGANELRQLIREIRFDLEAHLGGCPTYWDCPQR